MTQDFTENTVNVNEQELNEQVYNLLDGIDFEQSMSQPKSPTFISSTLTGENGMNLDGIDYEQVMSQPQSPTCIPSTLHGENGMNFDGIDFEQSFSQPQSPTCIPSTLPEENGMNLDGIDFEQSFSQPQSPKYIPSTMSEENGFNVYIEQEDEKEVEMTDCSVFKQSTEKEKELENINSTPVKSMEIFPQANNTDSDLYHSTVKFDKVNMNVEEKVVKSMSVPTPVIQPFICMEDKSPQNCEDPMDTLEETPVRDVGDTYLTEEQFNQKYPKHLIDQQGEEMETVLETQGQQQIHEEEQQQPMETVPHIMSMDELALFLDDQEKIGKVLGESTREMDNFLLSEVGNGSSAAQEPMDVQDEEETTRQSNQVCFLYHLFIVFYKNSV